MYLKKERDKTGILLVRCSWKAGSFARTSTAGENFVGSDHTNRSFETKVSALRFTCRTKFFLHFTTHLCFKFLFLQTLIYSNCDVLKLMYIRMTCSKGEHRDILLSAKNIDLRPKKFHPIPHRRVRHTWRRSI